MLDILAQGFGIVGLIIIVLSFQFKKNSLFFLAQGMGSFMFFLNFMLIGAYGGAMFNMCNLLRGLTLMKNPQKKWKLVINVISYVVCFCVSVYLDSSLRNIILVVLPCVALVAMSVFMWLGNSRHIRIFQILASSPAWIIHNIFNLSIGGLLCESFNMVSSVIYLFRLKKAKE